MGFLSIAVLGLAFLLNIYVGLAKPIKVACVGDSITRGTDGSTGADYPSVLQGFLGDGYEVTNLGLPGATMQKAGDLPYWITNEWSQALSSDADIFVIMLGTNDGKTINWKYDGVTGPEFYEADYKDMISQLRALKTSPALYTAIPPPCYEDFVDLGWNMKAINELLPPLIKKINDDMELPYPPINVFKALGGAELLHPDWFSDVHRIHPNDQGYAEIARVVRASLVPPHRQRRPNHHAAGLRGWSRLSSLRPV